MTNISNFDQSANSAFKHAQPSCLFVTVFVNLAPCVHRVAHKAGQFPVFDVTAFHLQARRVLLFTLQVRQVFNVITLPSLHSQFPPQSLRKDLGMPVWTLVAIIGCAVHPNVETILMEKMEALSQFTALIPDDLSLLEPMEAHHADGVSNLK